MSTSNHKNNTLLPESIKRVPKYIAERKAREAAKEAALKMKKAKEAREKKKAFENAQKFLENDRTSKRDEKFFKNNLSPGRKDALLRECKMEFQMNAGPRVIPRDLVEEIEILVSNAATSNFEFQGLIGNVLGTGAVNLGDETLHEVQTLNDTLKNITEQLIDPETGKVSLNHTLGDTEMAMLNTVNNSMLQLLEKLPDADDVKDIVSSTMSGLSEVFLKYSSLAAFVFVVISVIRIGKQRSKSNIFQLLFSLGLFIMTFMSYLGADSKKQLVDVMDSLSKKMNRTEGEMEHQMEAEDLSKVVELCGTALFFFATSSMKKTSPSFMMSMAALPRFMDSAKSVSSLLISTVEGVVNQIRRHILGVESMSFFEESSEDIQNFMNNCRDVFDKKFYGKLALTVENADRVNKLWTEGTVLSSKLNPREKTAMELRTRIREQLGHLSKLRSEFQQSNVFAETTRQVPLCVLIRGASGVGKSTITMPLVEELLAYVVDEEDLDMLEKHPDSFIYARMPEQKFWDAYRQQPICVFDDFGQLKDIPGGGENEFSELIRASNIFGFPLHMADLEAKGAVQFSSKMILCSTNLQSINPQSIVQPEAVRRRFNLVVDAIPKEEYCIEGTTDGDYWSRRLDGRKVTPGLDKEAMEFHVIDLKDKQKPEGIQTGEVLSYNQLMARLIKIYRQHATQHIDFKREKQASLSKAIENRRAGRNFEFQMADPYYGIKPSSPIVETFLDIDDIEKRFWFYDTKVLQDEKILQQLGNIRSLMKCHSKSNHLLLGTLTDAMPESFIGVSGAYVGGKSLLETDAPVEQKREVFRRWLTILEDNPDLCWSIRQEMTLPKNEKWRGIFEKHIGDFADSISRIWSEVKNCLNKIPFFSLWEQVKPFCTVAGFVVAGIATYKVSNCIYQFIRFLITGSPMEEHSTIRGNTEARDAKFVRARVNRAREKTGKMDHHFASADPVMNQICDKVIRDNCYEFWSGTSMSSGNATFVKENIFMIPWHYATKLAERMDDPNCTLEYTDNIVLRKANSTRTFTIPLACVLEGKRATAFETQDVCLVRCPRYVPHHADITKYFMKHDLALKNRDRRFLLVLSKADGNHLKWGGEHYTNVSNRWIGHEEGFAVRMGYEYRGMFQVGHCGALMLVVDKTTGAQKIIGIHTGGDITSGRGFATAVTQEDLLETLQEFEDTVEQLEPNHENVEYDFNFDEQVLDGRFKTLAKTNVEVHNHTVSEIIKSPLYAKWRPAITAPAKLKPFERDGVIIDPFAKGLSKYCLGDVSLDEEYFQCISNSVFEDIRRESKVVGDFRILSFREAVEGLIGDQSFKSIPRSKSSGFPYNAGVDKIKGKYKFFGDGQAFDFDRPEAKMLEARCEQIVKDARNGKRQFHVYSDYLKDERRPIEKVKEGKTRIFSGCPIESLIVGRMYFGAWTRFMTLNKIDNGCAVGVNPYSHDWQRMANKLNEKGPYCGAGDYSAFDGSEKPLVHWAIKDLIQKFYDDGEENSKIRDILWMEVVNSKHIRGNVVYAWESSLPSGHFMTIHINNLYNHFAFRYAWMREHDDDPDSLLDFHKHVYLITQGDDNLYSVSPEKIDIYNQKTIAVRLAEMGLTYTDELKSGEMVAHRPLHEVTFLKRSFRIDEALQRYVAPLSMDTILETPYWTKKGSESDEITISNTNDSLMELALHDKETFEKWQPKIVAAYAEAYPFVPLDLVSKEMLVTKSSRQEYDF